MQCLVLGGGGWVSDNFAFSLARALSAPFSTVYTKVFPDGESYVRLPREVGSFESVCLVKSLDHPQDKSVVELVLELDALRERGVHDVTLIIPYMAYARQDREFLDGEAVSIRALLRILRGAGARRLYVVEIHKAEPLKYFDGEAVNVSPYEYMARFLEVDADTVIIAPDLGAYGRAERLAKALGVEFDYLVKTRDRVTGEVSYKPKEVNVEGRNVIIVDDIISTGGTIAKSASMLRAAGARRVDVVAAHALLVGDAWSKIVAAGVRRVYAANTVRPQSGSPIIIDAAPAVAEAVRGNR
ncbi:MAG: ribose-phosphate diphosphokinase [Desulfurococcales archaeon]|nr:ribose-phosphate diphosphokinase [Desulfurococcales archaeon]